MQKKDYKSSWYQKNDEEWPKSLFYKLQVLKKSLILVHALRFYDDFSKIGRTFIKILAYIFSPKMV